MDKETSEIVKLTERISKDPKSKLFVPLAEEYKKIGDIEMSIHVLTEGLKNNPGYVTARTFLGRLLLEKGDLTGAQKEFEEVVKTIPDNLMAQRKLGDIYGLQSRENDALKHYKTALALNPNDAEIASLISDLEAGHDIKERLPKPKPQPVAEQPLQQEPHGTAARNPAPVKPASAHAEPGRLQAAQTSVPASIEPEVPEEVLAVEPLEQETRKQEQPSIQAQTPEPETVEADLDFLAEREQETLSTEAKGEPPGAFAADAGEFFAEPQILPAEAAETQPFGAEPKSEVPAGPQKSSDDFTTDTLAELYISQGFYEKAIDIYERMAAENPGSRKLKDKLARVRAMAGQSAGAEAQKKKAGSFPAFAAEAAKSAPAAAPEPKIGEYAPPQGEVFDEAPGFDAGFKAVEYVPPQTAKRHEEAPHPVPKTAAADRKETIDRLEHWLKNIMKEKK